MDVLESLKETYAINGIDPSFSLGFGRDLRYVHGTAYACLTELNPSGPDPIEYLDFAKMDISSGDERGKINSIGNTKRAIHQLTELFLEITGLAKAYGRSRFPAKLEIMRQLDAFPTRLLNNLNQCRNIVEHEYQSITSEQAEDFIDITEMFLRLCYPFLKQMYIELRVGLINDNRDVIWKLNPLKAEITVLEKENSKHIDSPFGIIHYDSYSSDPERVVLLDTIKISKGTREVWQPYLKAMVHWTKRSLIPSLPPYDPKDHARLMAFSSKCIILND
jgi:hypothetical protein